MTTSNRVPQGMLLTPGGLTKASIVGCQVASGGTWIEHQNHKNFFDIYIVVLLTTVDTYNVDMSTLI